MGLLQRRSSYHAILGEHQYEFAPFQHHGNRPAHAEYGMPAGCGVADIAIKVHSVEQCDYYVALHPLVDFASFIGDSIMGVASASEESVITLAVEAGSGFLDTAKVLGSTANDKFAVLANTRALAEAVAHELGFSTDKATSTATYLGTGQAADRRRRAPRTGANMFKRHKQDTSSRELKRCKRAMPGARGQMIGKVFRSGARPALTYGVEILGLNNHELPQLRRDHCRQVKPSYGCVSLTAMLALDGDLALRQAAALAL
eukprot:641647-Pyramimonas_sp.AAC.2